MNEGRVIGKSWARSPTVAGPRPSRLMTARRVGVGEGDEDPVEQ
jgi:hypothetical protein